MEPIENTSPSIEPSPNASDTDICVVCQQIIDDMIYSTLQCGHRLHTQCFLSAAQASDHCPVCRASLYPDEIVNEIVNENVQNENVQDETVQVQNVQNDSHNERTERTERIEIEIPVEEIGEEALNSIRREVSRLTSARNRRIIEEEEDDEEADDDDDDIQIINIDETPLLRQSRLTFSIFRACRLGELEEVRRIVNSHEEMATAEDDDYDTLLHIGVYSGNEQLVRYLINELSIPVNSINNFRMTPLHYAVSNSDIVTTTLLINSGAYVDVQDVSGKTPLIHACCLNKVNIVQLLLDRGSSARTFDASGDSPLHHSARGKCIASVKALLRHSSTDVNATNFLEETPLQVACASGSHTAVRFLLESGSDPDMKSKAGKKAIDYVIRDNSNTSSRLRHLLSLHMNN